MATLAQERLAAGLGRPRASRGSASRALTAYMYILPALIVMGVMTYTPMAFNLWMSFTNFDLKNLRVNAAAPDFVGLKNYIDILTNGVVIPNFDFWHVLGFNLFWTFSNVIFHVAIGILIAVLLNVEGLWFRGLYRAIFVLPIVIPTLVVATVWKNMFDPDYGAMN